MCLARTCYAAAVLLAIGCGSVESDQGNAAGRNANGGAGGAMSSSAGSGGTAAAGGAVGGSSGSTSAFALPASCAETGLDIKLGCEGCPAARPACECTDALYNAGGPPYLPKQACTFGKCLAAVDCKRVCQNFDPATGFGPEFVQQVLKVQDCLQILDECNGDTDCGIGNFCISGRGPYRMHGHSGLCSQPGHDCNEDADCLQGSRCAVFEMLSDPQTGAAIPYGTCSTGDDAQPCVVNNDCLTPYHCINQNAQVGGLVGQCSAGESGEPCIIDDDCVTPYNCVDVGGAGHCSAGAVNDACNEASDCQSGSCFGEKPDVHSWGTCTSGEFPAECLGPEDCKSGRCSVQFGTDVGLCVSGELASPCLYDTDCAGGLCGLNPGEQRGICVDGNTGSPCSDNADCPKSTCIAPSATTNVMCNGLPGSPCEGDGVCADVGACFKGKCG